eukprot:5855163-Alexandrium_andersonii.AAC.1
MNLFAVGPLVHRAGRVLRPLCCGRAGVASVALLASAFVGPFLACSRNVGRRALHLLLHFHVALTCPTSPGFAVLVI